MLYDLYLREDLKSRPGFSQQPDKFKLKPLYDSGCKLRKSIHIELFNYDIFAAALTGEVVEKDIAVLFDYYKRDPLSNSADTELIELAQP